LSRKGTNFFLEIAWDKQVTQGKNNQPRAWERGVAKLCDHDEPIHTHSLYVDIAVGPRCQSVVSAYDFDLPTKREKHGAGGTLSYNVTALRHNVTSEKMSKTATIVRVTFQSRVRPPKEKSTSRRVQSRDGGCRRREKVPRSSRHLQTSRIEFACSYRASI
jgi:hypothetical protein